MCQGQAWKAAGMVSRVRLESAFQSDPFTKRAVCVCLRHALKSRRGAAGNSERTPCSLTVDSLAEGTDGKPRPSPEVRK